MEQRYEANRRTGLWLERLVWNTAAGAVLAVMILLLLGSLRLLDAIAPEPAGVSVTVDAADLALGEGSGAAATEMAAPTERSTEVAGFNRPSP